MISKISKILDFEELQNLKSSKFENSNFSSSKFGNSNSKYLNF